MTYALSSHACPRCRISLYRGEASGVTLHGCGRCGGIWLASACARRIAEALPDEAIGLAERATKNATAHVDTSPAVVCLVCAQPMTRTRAAAAGIELDVCGAHGTWYDRAELEQIAKAIASSSWGGGAKRSKATAAAAGAAVAVGAAAAAAAQSQTAQSAQSTALETAAEIGAEVVTEVGVEIVIEGAFEVVGGILGAIFDS